MTLARLPIDDALPELLRSVRASGAVVLHAPTGAGKTTRVPPALLGDLPEGEIWVTEPRRIAARAAARRMALVWGIMPDIESREPHSFDDILDSVMRHEASSGMDRFVITAGYPYASDNSTDTIKVVERK